MKNKAKFVFHILPNAHLDPVWLWDWREGLNEGITTVSTVLDLMEEYPDLTFLRGEAAIYQHIQKAAPDVFRRVRERIEEGRWDVVGGTYIQPDSNLSSTETLCRQFEKSLAYFKKELGVRPTISWQADSFGHTAGWPNILRSFGMEGFLFTRPQQAQFPLDSPAFWWKCDYKDRLLCYRQHWKWYCSEHFNLPVILDETLAGAALQPFRNVGVLMGLGNHGGGPTRRHLAELESWKRSHPEVEVQFSTPTRFHRLLAKEVETLPKKQVPEIRGELGFCLRGCYSSVQKFKTLFRQAESAVSGAQITQGVIGNSNVSAVDLDDAWEAVLFNSFHDILPGSSIERAMDDQMAWTGLAVHHSQKAQFAALNQLAALIDTRVPAPLTAESPAEVPILLWNPLPREFQGPVEIEASLDYRPFSDFQHRADELPFALRSAEGEIIAFQEISTEHASMPDVPWRKRAVANLTIPALGWKVVRIGLAAERSSPQSSGSDCRAKTIDAPFIANDTWQVGVGKEGVTIKKDGRSFFSTPLRLAVFDDPWGSWGGMDETPSSLRLDKLREEWLVTQSQVLEHGPERARLWTRWEGRHSWVELTFDVCRHLPWVTVQGRLLWNERSARLQMIFPSTGEAVCDVPGSIVTRNTTGQVPVGRWFTRSNGRNESLGIASDVLSDADFLAKETRLTLARATRYANDVPTKPQEKRWQPAVDCGELKFRLAIFTDGVTPDHVADFLTFPPTALPVPPTAGSLPPTGSFGSLNSDSMRLLSLQQSEEGLTIRVQNRDRASCVAEWRFKGTTYFLGRIEPQQIVTQILPVLRQFSGPYV